MEFKLFAHCEREENILSRAGGGGKAGGNMIFGPINRFLWSAERLFHQSIFLTLKSLLSSCALPPFLHCQALHRYPGAPPDPIVVGGRESTKSSSTFGLLQVSTMSA
jgi:hypothetical protein